MIGRRCTRASGVVGKVLFLGLGGGYKVIALQ